MYVDLLAVFFLPDSAGTLKCVFTCYGHLICWSACCVTDTGATERPAGLTQQISGCAEGEKEGRV